MSNLNWGYSGKQYGNFRSIPVEEGNEYEAEITEITHHGDGIAKIEGFVVFVPGTKQGDHVRFRVTQVKDKFAIGETL